MSNQSITVGQSLEDFAAQAKQNLKRAFNGEIGESERHLGFQNMATFLRVMTERRFEIIQVLRGEFPAGASAYRVAEHLHRDKKNVRLDLLALVDAGLVEQPEKTRFFVPYDSMNYSVDLIAHNH